MLNHTFYVSFAYFQSVTLYGVAAIIERITSKESPYSKLYTVTISAFYTAVEGK